MKFDLQIIDSKHMDVLTKKENEITIIITEMTQRIADLKKLLDSKDVSLIFAYKSRNAEFKRSPKFKVSLPAFTSHKINKEEICKRFGFLTFSNKTKKHDYSTDLSETKLSLLERSIIDKPRVIKHIYTETKLLNSVSCLYDENIWVSGNDNAIRLYSLSGKKVKSITTTSRKKPEDIAVTKSGDLINADKDDRTVNLEKNGLIQTAIRLKGWKPRGVCCTFSGDLLVAMDIDDKKEAKVVRYADFTEKQTVQYDDKGEPLLHKYIRENLNICVSNFVVVVVNQAGNRRFTYTGRPFHTKKPFCSFGIATYSKGRILIADFNSTWIHILDQDGLFLRFIDNCHLSSLYGLCEDTSDNLFVTGLRTNLLKKIQYYIYTICSSTSFMYI